MGSRQKLTPFNVGSGSCVYMFCIFRLPNRSNWDGSCDDVTPSVHSRLLWDTSTSTMYAWIATEDAAGVLISLDVCLCCCCCYSSILILLPLYSFGCYALAFFFLLVALRIVHCDHDVTMPKGADRQTDQGDRYIQIVEFKRHVWGWVEPRH